MVLDTAAPVAVTELLDGNLMMVSRFGFFFKRYSAWFSRHWFVLFLSLYGLWVFTPFLAPLFIHWGWESAARVIYFFYSFFCHQLPQRSFFLFGERTMYSLDEIQIAWQRTSNPLILRQFIGNDSMGWKVAWSDRMVALYTSIWVFALFWYPLRAKVKPLPWWGFFLLMLPLVIDGGTHLISDLAGLGQGFRDSNNWLRLLTKNTLLPNFYAGDALGSFNSLMRLITGVLAGFAIAWLILPLAKSSSEEYDTVSVN
ncbi:MAG: DUF2085 domain-containing protein [Anaerolineales bacterium]